MDLVKESKRFAKYASYITDRSYIFNADLVYFGFDGDEYGNILDEMVPAKMNVFIGGLLGDFPIKSFD